MIKDKLKNIENYTLNENFEIFKEKMKEAIVSPEMLNPPFKVIPLEYETKEFDLTKFENHEKNIDIHYIIEGSEHIGINDAGNLVSNIPYNEVGDYQLFDGKVNDLLFLEKGDFLILFPGEAHVTGGGVDQISRVKKLVFKVPM